MAMEVCCGQCNGRLLVETPGEVVACPHCGVHLKTPLPDPPPPIPLDSPRHPSFAQREREAIERFSAETIVVKGSAVPFLDESPPIAPFSMHHDEPANRRVDSNTVTDALPPHFLESTDAQFLGDSAPVDVDSHQHAGRSDSHPDPVGSGAPDCSGDTVGSGDTVEFDRDDPLQLTPTTPLTLPVSPPFTAPEHESVSPADVHVPPPQSVVTAQSSQDKPDFSWMSDNANLTTAPSNAGMAFHLNLSPEDRHENSPPCSEHPATTNSQIPPFVTPVSGFSAEAFASPSPETTAGARMEPFSTADADGRNRTYEKSRASSSSMPMLLLVLGSYASLLTIYVVYMTLFGRQQQLESLPDLKTVPQLGGRALVPRPENHLPPGHDLQLGQTRRFGNIVATPLRVTRGPITFVHYTGDPIQERAPSDPVLKLWIRFENVSTDQTIAPLDTTLMFFRRIVENRMASYNAIFRADQQANPTPHYPFDRVAEDSEWRIVGQHTNESLAPQESFETFIPSEEHLDDLAGEIIWRVHFRKGHGPKSGNGVTTLIDVHFQTDEITADPA